MIHIAYHGDAFEKGNGTCVTYYSFSGIAGIGYDSYKQLIQIHLDTFPWMSISADNDF